MHQQAHRVFQSAPAGSWPERSVCFGCRADAAPRPKPDASHLIKAVELAGGRIDAAIMVGDSETDVATARSARTP